MNIITSTSRKHRHLGSRNDLSSAYDFVTVHLDSQSDEHSQLQGPHLDWNIHWRATKTRGVGPAVEPQDESGLMSKLATALFELPLVLIHVEAYLELK